MRGITAYSTAKDTMTLLGAIAAVTVSVALLLVADPAALVATTV